MNWPTVGSRITQYYSWRHLGLDIANKIGTPIYAADAGIVEKAGWSTGYGNNIIINLKGLILLLTNFERYNLSFSSIMCHGISLNGTILDLLRTI